MRRKILSAAALGAINGCLWVRFAHANRVNILRGHDWLGRDSTYRCALGQRKDTQTRLVWSSVKAINASVAVSVRIAGVVDRAIDHCRQVTTERYHKAT